MKLLSSMLFVASATLIVGALAGCSSDTPAYSAKERFAQIHRNEVYQSEAMNDDVDHALLTRPSDQDTIWNVFHR